METITQRLIQLREKNNLSKVADKLDLNKSAITRYESGEYKPTLDIMIKIHEVFGVSLDWLAGITNSNPNEYEKIVNECVDLNIAPEKLKKAIDLLKD